MKSSDDYSRRFPRCVNGKDWREPLDHPEIEKIARRADRTYQATALTNDERGLLLKLYEGLRKADRYLTHGGVAVPLKQAKFLPFRPWHGDGIGREMTEHNIGFVLRVRDFIQRLAQKHAGHASEDIPVEVDGDVPSVGDPGDDI
ncbi:MAG: hypothetical protein EOS43_20520 [Mesorhizobium sp.]|nr:MAG: hypothetical protein EOS43_20520 [Mesorhizobium sp.]